LGGLTAEWLRQDRRSFASGRPRPADFQFSPSRLQAYLSGIPVDRQEAEKLRYQQVSGIVHYLCKLMNRWTYEGRSIKLKNGTRLTGTVMANTKFLSIKTAQGRQRVQWSQLPVDQMANFLEYYGQMRLEATAGKVTDNERQKEGAWDFFRVGLLYDWYGDYPKAINYTKKAVATDRRLVSDVKKYIIK